MTETNDRARPDGSATGYERAESEGGVAEDEAVDEVTERNPDVVGPPNLAAALNVPAITRRE